MTFFTTEDRKIGKKINATSDLCPISYSSAQNKSPQQKSYAPFGSLSKKTVKEKKKDSVGPGKYQIEQNIIKPSIQQFENDNCIIIKINDQGSYQFKSNEQRFKNKEISITPGPGAYNFNSNKVGKQKRTKSSSTKINQISSHKYIKSRQPTLVSDPVEVPEEVKKQEKIKGGVRWELNRKERFHSQPKEVQRQEDKSIALDQMQRKRVKQSNRHSSFFASKSVKSCFDQLIYKSSNPYKVQLMKLFGFEDNSPGPGTYENANKGNKNKKSNIQEFGSTVKRFINNTSQNDLGPGYYSEQKVKAIKSQIRLKKPEKNKSAFQTETEDESNIGPGSYEIQNAKNAKESFNSNYKLGSGAFGSNKPRFDCENIAKKDLKPQYISFMTEEDEKRKMKVEEEFNYRRVMLKNKNQPVFQSESKRNCFHDLEMKSKTPFGTYDVGLEDINKRLKRQKQLEKQLQECHLSKPGFLSSVQRFKTEQCEVENHKDCWCRIKQVEKKSVDHMSYVFTSGSKRNWIDDMKNKGPAVGQYSKQNTMIKDSYNSKFIKKNQNKGKKIKFWKTKEAAL